MRIGLLDGLPIVTQPAGIGAEPVNLPYVSQAPQVLPVVDIGLQPMSYGSHNVAESRRIPRGDPSVPPSRQIPRGDPSVPPSRQIPRGDPTVPPPGRITRGDPTVPGPGITRGDPTVPPPRQSRLNWGTPIWRSPYNGVERTIPMPNMDWGKMLPFGGRW